MVSSMANIKRIRPIEMPDKTYTCLIPFEGQEEQYVRSGIMKSKDSLFHAALYGMNSTTKYLSKKEPDRRKHAHLLKAACIKLLTPDDWEHLNNGKIAKESTVQNIVETFTEIHKIFTDEIFTDENSNAVSIIVKKVVRDMLAIAQKNEEEQKAILEYCSEILKNVTTSDIVKLLEGIDNKLANREYAIVIENMKKFCIEYLTEILSKHSNSKLLIFTTTHLFKYIFYHSQKAAYQSYKKTFKNISDTIDMQLITQLSKQLDVNVYVLDANTGLPLEELHDQDYNMNVNKGSIVLLSHSSKNISHYHFEILGRLFQSKTVLRQFKPDDEFIHIIRTFIVAPHTLQYKYPHLIKYLPEDIQKQLKLTSKNNKNSNNRYDESDKESSVSNADSEDDKLSDNSHGSEYTTNTTNSDNESENSDDESNQSENSDDD